MKKFLILIIASSAILLSACSGPSLPKPTPLTDFTSTTQVMPLWSNNTGVGADDMRLALQPAIDDELIYTTDIKGRISAVNLTTGRTAWATRYKDMTFTSNVATDQSAIYLGTNQGKIVKFNKANGQLIWTAEVPSTVVAAPITNDDNVYVKTINEELSVFSSDDAKLKWTDQQSLPSLVLRDSSSPVIDGDSVLVGYANGKLISYNSANGQALWNKQLTVSEGKTDVERMVDIDTTPVIKNGIIYAANYQGSLVALDGEKETQLWQAKVSTYNNIALDDNNIYLTDNDGNVRAYSQTTGRELWKQDKLKYRELSAPVVIGNNVITADKEGYIHFLSTSDGHLIARVKSSSDGISADPMVINQNVLVIFSNDGKLQAYRVN
jgi:outer membrane protein assembly factor BamB